MTYKETLFFVARALTINHEEHNYEYVVEKIKNELVNWDQVVQLSTKHYVFPAMYCNLKRAKLLNLLPEELVAYMEHITDLNRDRNKEIVKQAQEINRILLQKNIEPIFLKGIGFLLQNFYEDIAERMVGDIDFIVDKKDFQKTIDILKERGYDELEKKDYHFPQFKHYGRLINSKGIAAVEVHKELLIEGYHNEFNFELIQEDLHKLDYGNVMSLENQLCLAVFAKQVNDEGQFFHDIALRNAYDSYLLSLRVNSKESISRYKKLFDPLNNFLAICNYTFNSDKILFLNSDSTETSLKVFKRILENKEFGEKRSKSISRTLAIKKRLKFIYNALYRKENRIWMWKRFWDKEWQEAKLIQFGFKRPKS